MLLVQSMQPPSSSPVDFDYDAAAIHALIDNEILATRRLGDEIAKVLPPDCTFDSVVLPLVHIATRLSTVTGPVIFLQSVHPDPAIREAATLCDQKISVRSSCQPLNLYGFHADLANA